MSEWEKKGYCCEAFYEAGASGTDNEGYGAAVNYVGPHYVLGSFYNEPIKFCPYCGTKLFEKSKNVKI